MGWLAGYVGGSVPAAAQSETEVCVQRYEAIKSGWRSVIGRMGTEGFVDMRAICRALVRPDCSIATKLREHAVALQWRADGATVPYLVCW